jgi:hypothetical protein
MAGKPLKGSKSVDNLKDAFAGESQANRRYLYFARVADIEGFSRTPPTPRPATPSATSTSSRKWATRPPGSPSARPRRT